MDHRRKAIFSQNIGINSSLLNGVKQYEAKQQVSENICFYTFVIGFDKWNFSFWVTVEFLWIAVPVPVVHTQIAFQHHVERKQFF